MERPLTADEQTAYYDYTVENDPQIQRAVSTAQQMSGTTTAVSYTHLDVYKRQECHRR